jgi:hypothetical protein
MINDDTMFQSSEGGFKINDDTMFQSSEGDLRLMMIQCSNPLKGI